MTRLPKLYFSSGVHALTGEYLDAPRTAHEIVGRALSHRFGAGHLDDLRDRTRRAAEPHYGVVEGVDPNDLAECGWGVLLAEEDDSAPIKEALSELLQLRRTQAGDRFYELTYRRGETKNQFLKRYRMGPGPVNPERLPYYILIVADPESVPLQFQFELDVQFALGRIHFDRIEDYAHYAAGVVQSERGEGRRSQRAVIFAPQNPDDPLSRLCNDHLARPLAERLQASAPDWAIEPFLADEATKSRLSELLNGDQPPAFLLTASHGLVFSKGHRRQMAEQGAVLCQDWPGPQHWGGGKGVPREHFFGGEDVGDQARLQGLLSFHFACFSSGTPRHDYFARSGEEPWGQLADRGFLAALPKRLLGHPGGGSLAVVGHIERAWLTSFMWGGQPQAEVFECALTRLMDGHRLGSAMEHFNHWYAELSTMLVSRLEEIEDGARPDVQELAELWTATNDARSYLVMGDPAVRLNDPNQGRIRGRSLRSARPIESTRGRPATPGSETDSERSQFVPPTGSGDRDESRNREERSAEPTQAGKFDDAPLSDRVEAAAKHAVNFSAFHPRSVSPRLWSPLLVYAHLERDWPSVQSDADALLSLDAETYAEAQAESTQGIPMGTEITLAPHAPGLQFRPAMMRITWKRTWERADFQVRAEGDNAADSMVEASIGCYAGPLLLAEVRLPIRIGDAKSSQQREPSPILASRAKAFQAIFASYSHSDTSLVEAVEAACRALGIDYLRDVMTLKSGQDWSEELLGLIEEADVFQLFWSWAASRSPYVEQEWRHALQQRSEKGQSFIRPVYWEEDLPPVPERLAAIHFRRIDAEALAAQEGKTGPAPGEASKSIVSSAEQPSLAADHLPTAFEGLTELTVSTYASLDPAEPQDGDLRIRSRVSLVGETMTSIAEPLGETWSNCLKLHLTVLRETLKIRIEYLRVLMGLNKDKGGES